jgi:membrane fusion protein (multidrug efflux system)
MIKKLSIAIIGVAVLIGGLFYIKQAQQFAASQNRGGGPQPVAVTTAVVEERSLRPTISAIGTLSAAHGVLVSAEVSGAVSAIHFESGHRVGVGDLIVELDASSEQAQLKAAAAQTRLAKIRFERSLELRAKNTIAQSDLDTAEAEYSAAQAQVENLESLIAKKRIRAPFDGKLGIRKIEIGQYLNAGTEIVSLQSLSRIHANFSLPQQRISQLKTGMAVEVSTDAFPGETFTGVLTAIAPEVSISTRSLSLQATLENSDERLLPGMFASVNVVLKQEKPSLILPATSILFAPFGDSVFVVEEKDGMKIATQKFISVASNFGDYVSIESGLELGDVVVSTGGFKLRNGVPIAEKNDFAPETEIAPTPEDA